MPILNPMVYHYNHSTPSLAYTVNLFFPLLFEMLVYSLCTFPRGSFPFCRTLNTTCVFNDSTMTPKLMYLAWTFPPEIQTYISDCLFYVSTRMAMVISNIIYLILNLFSTLTPNLLLYQSSSSQKIAVPSFQLLSSIMMLFFFSLSHASFLILWAVLLELMSKHTHYPSSSFYWHCYHLDLSPYSISPKYTCASSLATSHLSTLQLSIDIGMSLLKPKLNHVTPLIKTLQ